MLLWVHVGSTELCTITLKPTTVSHLNRVFQARYKDFQDRTTAFRPLLTPADLGVSCLYKSSQVIEINDQNVVFCLIFLPHHEK